MENSKVLDHPIFCSGCKQHIRPEIILHSITKEEVKESTILKEAFDTYYNPNPEDENSKVEKQTIIRESVVPTEYGFFEQENQILKCTVNRCGKKYLRLYPNLEGKEEIIPISEDWFLFPIDNPIDEGEMVIPIDVYKIHLETIKAYNENMPIACGFLLGATLESICIEEKIKEKLYEEYKKEKMDRGKYKEGEFIMVKLSKMLPALVAEKTLDHDYEELLRTIAKVRNDAAHGMAEEPTIGLVELEQHELSAGIESIRYLLEEVYLDKYFKKKRKQSSTFNKHLLNEGLKNRRNKNAS